MKTKIKYLIVGFILCLVVTYVYSLVKCEILTHKHYDEFEDSYKQTLDDIEFFKVLEYKSCDVAKVYYVSEGHSLGSVLVFTYEDGNWKEIYWNTLWSTSGNADKTVYPYWWHWIYFIF